MSTVRTLVADDNESMRRVLRAILGTYPEIEVIGEASNGEEAIEKANALGPDLILMDVSMPQLDGLTAAEVIRKYRPRIDILMISMHRVREFVETAKRLGLSGYAIKDQGNSLPDAINAILHHQTYFPLDRPFPQ